MLRNGLAELICAIAKIVLPEGKWPNFFDILFQLYKSEDVRTREVALYIIHELNEAVSQQFRPHYPTFFQMLGNSMQPDQPESLRIQACKTAGAIVSTFTEDDDNIQTYGELLPHIIETIRVLLDSHSHETSSVFEAVENMIEACSNMFENAVVPMTQIYTQIVLHEPYLWELRQYALHTLEVCVKLKPVWFVKNNLVTTFIDVGFQLGCEADPEFVDEWDLTPNRAANAFHDVLARFLNPKHTYQHFLLRIRELASSQNPLHRREAVTTLSAIADGCSESIRDEIQDFIPYLVQCFNDPEEIVQRGACVLLGNFSQYLKPEILDYHHTLLPCIINAIVNGSERVKESACYSLICYLQDLEEGAIHDQVEPLLKILVETLTTTTNIDLQEMAITAIGAVSVSSREHFLPFFENVIHLFKDILSITDEDRLVLRSRAIDAIGEISTVVGKEKFAPYFQYFMERGLENFTLPRLIPSKNQEEKLSNDIRESTFSFFSTVATTMGEGFSPFMDQTMNLIMETVQSNQNETGDSLQEQLLGILSDEEEGEAEELQGIDSNDPEYINKLIENMNYSSGLTEIDEKVSAIHCLGSIAAAIGAPFMAYIEPAMLAVNILVTSLFPSARRAAMYALENFTVCMNKLLPSPREGWQPGLPPQEYPLHEETQAFIDSILETISNCLECEFDLTVAKRYLDTIEFIGENFGLPAIYKHENMIVGILQSILEENTIVQAEALEEIDNEEIAQECFLYYSGACQLVITLSDLYRDNFYHILDQLAKPFHNMVYSKSPERREWRHRVIATYSSIIENTSLEQLKDSYVKTFLTHALLGAQDEEYAFRANSAYVLGLLCKHPLTQSMYDTVLENIMGVLTMSTEPRAIDNACGAMCRAIYYAPHLVPLEPILPELFDKLPLREDHAEDEAVYPTIMLLLEQGNQAIVPFIPKIVDMFTTLLTDEEVKQELKQEMAITIKKLWGSYEEQLREVVEKLTQQQQGVFQQCLQ